MVQLIVCRKENRLWKGESTSFVSVSGLDGEHGCCSSSRMGLEYRSIGFPRRARTGLRSPRDFLLIMKSESFSLLCTTRFDPFLETFEWNNAPDGTPSPYLLLAHQLDRLVSSARLSRWTVADSLDYTALKDVCDKAVRKVNADGKTPLKVIEPPVLCQALTRACLLDTCRLPVVRKSHCVRLPSRAIAL